MNTSDIRKQIDLIDEQIDELEHKLDDLRGTRHGLEEDYEESKRIDLANFVATVQLDANAHGDPIGTICKYQAFDMLIQWARDGVEFPEGLTLDTFTAEWNHQIKNGRGK